MQHPYSSGRLRGFLRGGLAGALLAASALAVLAGAPTSARAAAGGPDAFGYTFKDNTEPGGPVYNFTDIHALPGHIYFALSDDQEIHFVTPFPVTIYGVTTTSLGLSNNGSFYVNDTGTDFSWVNQCLSPTTPLQPPAAKPFVAALWDDPISLTPPCNTNGLSDGLAGVYLLVEGTAPARKLTIQWHDQNHYNNTIGVGCSSERDRATWQCILFENSQDIVFQYADTTFSTNPASSLNNGGSATIGIRGVGAGNVLQYSCNQSGAIVPGRAIRFYAPLPPPDCNNNTIDDAIDISSGFSTDCNLDGVPDECDPVVETITLRSGNGTFSNGAADSTINVLVGPVDGPFGAGFTPAQFAAAAAGPDAIMKDPIAGTYLPATNGALPADGLAKWITTSLASQSTGLYAHSFTVSSDRAPAASLIMQYAADSQVGSSAIPAIYLNGIPISCTVAAGSAGTPTNLRCNRIGPLLIPGGTNTLYIYNNDANGGPSGVIYSATILITQPELDITCKPAVVEIGPDGTGTLAPASVFSAGTSACGPITPISVTPNFFTCADLTGMHGNPATLPVTLTAENTAGNQGTCVAQVTVVDHIGPTFTNCPESPFVRKCNHPDGYLFVPEYTDNCEPAGYDIVANGVLLEPGAALPFGTYPVTITAYDASGNATECNFIANILPDLLDLLRPQSVAALDGYVTAPNLVTMAEGTVNSKSQEILVGDGASGLGTRGILSFDLSGLPEGATITGARVRLTRKQAYGNPSVGFGPLKLDMATPYFGEADALSPLDYTTTDTEHLDIATSFPYPTANAYVTFAEIGGDYLEFLDDNPTVQFRVRFQNETNGNAIRDEVAFVSGNGTVAIERPELIIEYYLDECYSFQTFPAPEPTVYTSTFYSVGPNDGGVTESHFTSEVGGTTTATSGSFPVGDTASRQQQIGIVSFDTSSIPDNATILSAELRLYCTGRIGGPTTLGALLLDMRNPFVPVNAFFGSTVGLLAEDFQAWAHFPAVGTITPLPTVNTYTPWVALNADGRLAINRTGVTQIRLRFADPDDGDALTDTVTFAAAEIGATSPARPTLVVQYRVPAPSRAGATERVAVSE